MRNLFIFVGIIATMVLADHGKIDSLKRRAMMLEPDVTVFKTEVKFELPKNAHKQKQVTFSHVVPIDYADEITDVLAKDIENKNLKVQRVSGPSFKIAELPLVNLTDYLWYEIDITEAAQSALNAKETIVTLELTEYFKRRRAPYPRRITLKDK